MSQCTLLPAFAAIGLSACAPVNTAIWSTGKQLVLTPTTPAAPDTSAPLDARFEYLYVTVMKSSFWATKVHAHATSAGLEEVWLTPGNEVLRTLNGRITSTTGSQFADWTRSSTTAIASWERIVQLTQAGRSVVYQRTRDVEPGGFVALKEQVTVSAIPPPPSHRFFPAEAVKDLYWVEERSEFLDTSGRLKNVQSQSIGQQENPLSQPLPPARFALRLSAKPNANKGAVAADWVYAEQCLSYKVCLSMQRWNKPQTAVTTAH